MALHQDGTLWTWGNNNYGQLGDGTFTSRSTPRQIGSSAWQQVSAGYFHTLGVRQDGTLWAWGYNGNGQLGDGTRVPRNSPVQIGLATTWHSVSAGYDQCIGRRTDGTLWGWGANQDGQLGLPSSSSKQLLIYPLAGPLPVGLTAFTARNDGPQTIRLSWTTASENKNAGFVVERSTDAQHFTRLGFAAGVGTTTRVTQYTYLDAALPAASPILYYRLRQEDHHGRFTYSPVRTVWRTHTENAAFTVYPTVAFDGNVLYDYAGPALPPTATLEVYTLGGQRIRTLPAPAIPTGQLVTAGLAPGWYVLRLTAGKHSRAARFFRP